MNYISKPYIPTIHTSTKHNQKDQCTLHHLHSRTVPTRSSWVYNQTLSSQKDQPNVSDIGEGSDSSQSYHSSPGAKYYYNALLAGSHRNNTYTNSSSFIAGAGAGVGLVTGYSNNATHKHSTTYGQQFSHTAHNQIQTGAQPHQTYFPLPKVSDIDPYNICISVKSSSNPDSLQQTSSLSSDVPIVSYSIHSHMCKIKQQIEKHNDMWDNIKKFTNPYEFIHTNVPGYKSSVSKMRPISRSFYKMVEITQTARLLDKYKSKGITLITSQGVAGTIGMDGTPPPTNRIQTFHLAEGPGGFIEAISYLRGLQNTIHVPQVMAQTTSNTPISNVVDAGAGQCDGEKQPITTTQHSHASSHHRHKINLNDTYYGMTLLNDDPICPGWKKSKHFLDNNPNVVIETGIDNTGNLLSIDNYKYCCSKYKNSMDIITADGGFDFSVDFNNQEHLAINLIIAEVFYAISLQKKGGSFVLKIFDMFFKNTIDIVYLLCSCYEDVSIIKPYTSRMANSEKYVICKSFKYSDSSAYISRFTELYPVLNGYSISSSIMNHSTIKDVDDNDVYMGGHEYTYGRIDNEERSDASSDACSDACSDTCIHEVTGNDTNNYDNPSSNTTDERSEIISILTFEEDIYFLSKVEDINALLCQQQIENITNTLSLISTRNTERLEGLKKTHLQKCISWCEKYGISHHKMNVASNIFLH